MYHIYITNVNIKNILFWQSKYVSHIYNKCESLKLNAIVGLTGQWGPGQCEYKNILFWQSKMYYIYIYNKYECIKLNGIVGLTGQWGPCWSAGSGSWRTTRCCRGRCRWWWRSGRSWRGSRWSRGPARTWCSASRPRSRTPSGTPAALTNKIKKKFFLL